ncbi:MotA/TolQ/ExbB proton channel family protein [Coraliomargarita sp. SDUM461003]|uniref:MotA/TolQ/ExbB proton channel family protein n=1 Tax=Thalassobacterium maritimum TaxID=3041265 RepID=A0ABU1APD5_9BACT|nr:MotA/TolQ/ExbB proton channel family protein [Coraliomargarita sp. SDUM461003]MDQ8206037.1 MotA/TolQ/ExbB proton channel family protein [Coraliomargarita sp. SDUM461003]
MNTRLHLFHFIPRRFTLAFCLCLVWASVVHGQAEVAIETTAPVENITLWTMFQQGGWAMYPLLAFSVATVGLAGYCGLIIKEKRFTQPEARADLRAAIEARDVSAGLSACDAHPGYMTDILRLGFETVGDGYDSVAEVNEALEERAGKVLAGPLVFVQYLQVVASVSPMMGLLGTVSGMVKAFRNIAAQGLGKPELLANNISEALVTTASGLLIAIPALMCYFYFKNKYMAASSGIYERLGEMTRLMKKNGMVSEAASS